MMNTERYGSCRSISIFIYCTAHPLFWHLHPFPCSVHDADVRLMRYEHIDVFVRKACFFSDVHAGFAHLAHSEFEHFTAVHAQIAVILIVVKILSAAALTAELEGFDAEAFPDITQYGSTRTVSKEDGRRAVREISDFG